MTDTPLLPPPACGALVTSTGETLALTGVRVEADVHPGSVSVDVTTTFVNDVVLSRGAAWFTDSLRAVLYRVPAGRTLGTEFTELPLTGDWAQVPGFNANGIAATPDHRGLLVVQSATGLLFRVDPATGEATTVDLGGYVLTAGDGLLVHGTTLYVVQNRLNQVAVFALRPDGTAGRLLKTITSPERGGRMAGRRRSTKGIRAPYKTLFTNR